MQSSWVVATSIPEMWPLPGGNDLLARVRPADAERVSGQLQRVHVPRGHQLAVAGEPQPHVYFPTGCLISVFVRHAVGRGTLVGVVGREGFVGLPVLLGTQSGPQTLMCEIAGDALRMPSERFRSLVRRTAGFRRLLLQYAGARLVEESHHLACIASHSGSPRLARWLLITRDRVGSNDFPLTQEFLAQMLAVRRPYLTRLMQDLRRRGHITYKRGRINILSGAGLTSVACEDYRLVRSMYARLLMPVAPVDSASGFRAIGRAAGPRS
jgi:CRP-like cAMP-binding protein